MARPAKPVGALFCVGSKDHDDEDERGHKLKDDGRGDVVAALVAGAPAVLTEAAGGDVVAACNADGDDGENPCGQRATDKLAYPVAEHVLDGHASGNVDAEADGWIDVATGDGANAVGSADQRQSKGEGDAESSNNGLVACHHRRATTEEHQDKGAHEFREVLFHASSCYFFSSNTHMPVRAGSHHKARNCTGDVKAHGSSLNSGAGEAFLCIECAQEVLQTGYGKVKKKSNFAAAEVLGEGLEGHCGGGWQIHQTFAIYLPGCITLLMVPRGLKQLANQRPPGEGGVPTDRCSFVG